MKFYNHSLKVKLSDILGRVTLSQLTIRQIKKMMNKYQLNSLITSQLQI